MELARVVSSYVPQVRLVLKAMSYVGMANVRNPILSVQSLRISQIRVTQASYQCIVLWMGLVGVIFTIALLHLFVHLRNQFVVGTFHARKQLVNALIIKDVLVG